MKRYRLVMTAGALLLLLSLMTPIVAQTAQAESDDDGTTNVLLTFRMGTLDNGQKTIVKSYTLVVAAGSDGSSLLSGRRVPFPGGTGEGGESIVYQNIGFSAHVRVWLAGEKRIKLAAELEDSRVIATEDGDPPTVETRQLHVNAVLTDGVPLDLTRVNGVSGHSGFVEVEAQVLR